MNEVITNIAALVCLVGFNWGIIALIVFAADDLFPPKQSHDPHLCVKCIYDIRNSRG
jgi:hypothetical protein